MTHKDALQQVVLRNSFYKDNFRRMVFVLLFSVVLNIMLTMSFLFVSMHRPKPYFFASTPSGSLVRLAPLTSPVMNDAQVTSWLAQVVPAVYALDFVNYRRELESVQKYFTPFGWNNFLQAFNGQLKNIVDNQYVTSAVVTAPPVIIATAVIRGDYTWKLQVPVMVTYTHGSTQTTQNFIWTVILQRMNNNVSEQLLGITQIIETPEN